jgi:hypothetical protein
MFFFYGLGKLFSLLDILEKDNNQIFNNQIFNQDETYYNGIKSYMPNIVCIDFNKIINF